MAHRQPSHVSALLGRLNEDQTGVTGLEYTMIAAIISVAAIVGINAVGDGLLAAFSSLLP